MSAYFHYLFLLLGLARRDVKRRSGWSERLGKDVHPHHQASLTGKEPVKTRDKDGCWKYRNVFVSPAGCPAAVGCTALWFPHVQV